MRFITALIILLSVILRIASIAIAASQSAAWMDLGRLPWENPTGDGIADGIDHLHEENRR